MCLPHIPLCMIVTHTAVALEDVEDLLSVTHTALLSGLTRALAHEILSTYHCHGLFRSPPHDIIGGCLALAATISVEGSFFHAHMTSSGGPPEPHRWHQSRHTSW